MADRIALAKEILKMADVAGASAAEVLIREGTEFSAGVRLGQVEKLQQANFRKLVIRVFDGKRSAISATSDHSAAALRELITESLSMARAAGEDSAAGLPPPEEYDRAIPVLALAFPSDGHLSLHDKVAMAKACEEASLKYNPQISNSEGSEYTDSLVRTTYANSLNIAASYEKTRCSLSTTALAELDGIKQRDYWLSTHVDFSRLQSPAEVGREAARRALRRLGARKIPTCEVPVIFEPLPAASLLRHLADAVSGTALMRQASFMMGRLGEQVASAAVNIRDDALLTGAPGSRPFDAEGVPSRSTIVIRDGIFENYLLDAHTARRLGLRSTGNSNRDPQGNPSVGPSNFYLSPGGQTPAEIVASLKRGLYVTEVIGFGVNVVSGDYSQGAAGLWVENGELAFPVEEITIAGNLKEMLTRIEAVGNDLPVLGEVFSPTILVGRMVVSGS